MTVSVGVCTFPDHGESVTELLTTTALTLQEAKASGGDAIRFAGRARPSRSPASRTFDVFQGLVFAVDTKDRYTKRHSEDVARYSVFLAERLGARRPSSSSTIRVAGLLHDVGKIGIPDDILRKPGKLTRRRVRDRQAACRARRPDRPRPARRRARSAPGSATTTSAGTGRATSTGLAGSDIPLIARILAVATPSRR